jgi:hypothetical protein
LTGTRSRGSWHPMCLRSGKRGRPIRPKPCSVPRRRSQGATAPCLRGITPIGACPSVAPRYGRCGITSMVAPQRGRRQPRGFAGGEFLTSAKRCYRMSMTCPNLGNAIRSWRSVVEVIRCSALSGYPARGNSYILPAVAEHGGGFLWLRAA